jgi:hypothetical protein
MTKKASNRFRRRRSERGAIVFVVAMTLAVLASLGLFALVAASGEVKTAGYGRQNLQSHYLAESGVVATAFLLNADPGAILGNMTKVVGAGHIGDYDSAQPRSQCWSLDAVTTTVLAGTAPAPPSGDIHPYECKILNYRPTVPGSGTDLVSKFIPANNLNTNGFDQWPKPVLAPAAVNAAIRIEVTDPVVMSPLAGYAQPGGGGYGDNSQTVMTPCTVTITTYGETAPQSGTYGTAGLEVGRARITFPTQGKTCH